MNPVWNKGTKEQDVSVIRVKDRIRWGVGVQPACLAHPGWSLPNGFICVVTGWGMTDGFGNQAGSRTLLQARVS